VIWTIRSPSDEATARRAGAHEVVLSDGKLTASVKALVPNGVDHIVEVAFGANIETGVDLLNMGGSIGAYATNLGKPAIPFWPMAFKNIRLYCLGSDDFPKKAKQLAARDLNSALESGWLGFEIAERIPPPEIARAHEAVEHPARPGRVVVTP
jgi:NADPH:quinone reductase